MAANGGQVEYFSYLRLDYHQTYFRVSSIFLMLLVFAFHGIGVVHFGFLSASEMTDLIVTTCGKPSGNVLHRARNAALRWNVPFTEREWKAPLRSLLDQAKAAIVFGQRGVELWDAEGHITFHEGLAALR